MVSLGRKRKGTKFSSFAGSHLSDGDGGGDGHGRLNKKKTCRGPEKPGSGAAAGVVMTARTAGSTSCDIRVRGLKRKLGCIDPTTRIARRKRLENEYDLGHEIGKGKFGAVRLCRSRTSGEECACKTLPKGTDELVHREVEIMQHLSGHPGVVTLKAVFEDADCFHIVMELCTGGRLLDQMVRNFLVLLGAQLMLPQKFCQVITQRKSMSGEPVFSCMHCWLVSCPFKVIHYRLFSKR